MQIVDPKIVQLPKKLPLLSKPVYNPVTLTITTS